ncbi:hypothetical protein DFP72DRAFT_1169871 [Ephemerocybe angulata]|uniref:Uncharacterized protein n=1 Tax=Ephemerocybe angulata TaxID=980116 RepID=A0A8H6M429_9AGAR|nr:hypothetical protein DFP72DRAFT_1169871 [Tulosesus angulatus]
MGFQRLMNSNAATTETQGFGIRRLRSSPHKQRRRQQRQKLSKPGSMCDENHSPLGGADRTPRRMDCGRRIQALGRMAIWELEPATVEIKSFVP